MSVEYVTLSSSIDRSYPVCFESVDELPSRLNESGIVSGPCVVVSDKNVEKLYRESFNSLLLVAGFKPKWFVVPAGEESKSFGVFENLCTQILEAGVERNMPLFAFGGGVVGDLGGYTAASILRGIPFIQIPTTLVAQVDSSIGGKTGINHLVGKNLIGAFYQPRLVLADVAFLESLPEKEWHGGLAEVVKHALIADLELFDQLETHWSDVLRSPEKVANWLVPKAASVKIGIVSEDEREQGNREWLNFGHTFGHALERLGGYGALSHGEAVAYGMHAALLLSAKMNPSVDFDRAIRMVRSIPKHGHLPQLTSAECLEAMRSDKKVREQIIRVVLLKNVGFASVRADINESEILGCWQEWLSKA